MENKRNLLVTGFKDMDNRQSWSPQISRNLCLGDATKSETLPNSACLVGQAQDRSQTVPTMRVFMHLQEVRQP